MLTWSCSGAQTVSAINTFFLAMTLHPEVQAKAVAEIESVIGTDRLPTMADRESLPYVNAVFLETLRWNNVAPLGMCGLSLVRCLPLTVCMRSHPAPSDRGRRPCRLLPPQGHDRHRERLVHAAQPGGVPRSLHVQP